MSDWENTPAAIFVWTCPGCHCDGYVPLFDGFHERSLSDHDRISSGCNTRPILIIRGFINDYSRMEIAEVLGLPFGVEDVG